MPRHYPPKDRARQEPPVATAPRSGGARHRDQPDRGESLPGYIDRGAGLCYLLAVARKAGKADKEALKAPDQFVSFWGRVAEGLAKRRKPVLGAAAALVVIAVGIVLVQALFERRAEKASLAFARIQKVAAATLLPAEGEAPKYDDGVQHFKTEKERLEAALDEVDTFLSSYGGSPLADEAKLLKASYLVQLDRAKEAVTLYQQLRGSLPEALVFLAREGLAFAHEAAGQTDQALAEFSALADGAKTEPGSFMRDRALYNKARLLEQKGDKAAATKTYKEILAEAPTSALKDKVSDRLAVLEDK